MTAFSILLIAVVAAMGCSSSSPAAADAGVPDAAPDAFPVDPDATITGTVSGGAFRVGDVLLVHPQTWKSGIQGETAILISSTPRLCDQIVSGKTTAPGELLIISLEQVPLATGSFTTTSSPRGDVYFSAVDARCAFSKESTDQVQIDVSQVGPPVAGTFTAHYQNGDAITAVFSASASCDEVAVDTYLNRNPTCP
jgi:hypothetical protein